MGPSHQKRNGPTQENCGFECKPKDCQASSINKNMEKAKNTAEDDMVRGAEKETGNRWNCMHIPDGNLGEDDMRIETTAMENNHTNVGTERKTVMKQTVNENCHIEAAVVVIGEIKHE